MISENVPCGDKRHGFKSEERPEGEKRGVGGGLNSCFISLQAFSKSGRGLLVVVVVMVVLGLPINFTA